MCPLRVILLCPLRVLLLWTLLCPGTGKVQEIFTRPGSDLLLPIRIHPILNHTDTGRCDWIYWTYQKSHGVWEEIAKHRNCDPSYFRYFLNIRLSENGSLIISNVTLQNDGRYGVVIVNSAGHRIQIDDYVVHVEGKVPEEIFTRPGSDLLIPIRIHLTLNPTDRGRCDWIMWTYETLPGVWKQIVQHWNCDPSDFGFFPNTRISENGSLIISNVTPENDGRYRVHIENSTGPLIQRDDYTVHVEGKAQEIFTRLGSDLLIPITRHFTLNRPDTGRCDWIIWYYEKSPGDWEKIAEHRNCDPSDVRYFPNTRISENGSLIISNVTLENDGMYRVYKYNSIRDRTQRDDYFIHVEVPVSVPLLHVSCLRNGSAEISCRVEEGTKPDIRLSVIGGSQERYSTSANNITAIVGSPGPWNITCTVENEVSRSEESRAGVTCPVPLSDITVTSSCLPDGSAEAECSVKGSDPRYSWSLDGRSVSSHRRVTLPPPVSGTLHCDVTNQINNLSRSINIFCPVPVSDPVLDVRCLQNNSTEISCEVKNGTDSSIFLTVNGQLRVYNVTSTERTVRVTVPTVSPPNSWNIRCSAKNSISERSTNQTIDACPDSRSGMWSDWGHLLSHGVMCVLNTALLIYIVNDLRKMKTEKNRSERRTRRRDLTEMKMEPTYYN
ncbi:hemicentin-1-like isoform X2 [Lithobates pipiens]